MPHFVLAASPVHSERGLICTGHGSALPGAGQPAGPLHCQAVHRPLPAGQAAN